MADIFISYAREDYERAKTLAEVLARQGWSVWWDQHIPSGRRFYDVIERELTAARCVIVLWSTAALGSPWVREEAQDGLDRDILVPARIEAVRLPIGFRTVQTADLSDWNGNPAHPGFRQLVEDIRAVLGEASLQKPVPESEAKPQRPVETEARQAAEEQQREALQRRREQDEARRAAEMEAARVHGTPGESEEKPALAKPRERATDRAKPAGRAQASLSTPIFHQKRWVALFGAVAVIAAAGVIVWQELEKESLPTSSPPPGAEDTMPAKQRVVIDKTFPHFPVRTGRVVDEAEIIDPADEHALKAQLAMYETDTTNQIVVVTVKSLRGMAIEEFSFELGNYWGVGQSETNNGVLLVVAPVDRHVRIEVGVGLQDILTDAKAKHIIDEVMLPHFRSGLYSLGIVSGVNAIIEDIGM